MEIDILTLFPNMFRCVFEESILKRAQEQEKVTIRVHNFRTFSKDPHQKVDDTPYGGGQGMVLSCQPLFDAVRFFRREDSMVILLTPDGIPYKQKMAYRLAQCSHLILICGHYEGFDERIRTLADLEISIGDFILTGGEIPAMVLVDSITRLLDGVIKESSHQEESFNQNLLDYPNYTKPSVYEGLAVPQVLLSGDHQKIKAFREEEAYKRTQERRPDLLKESTNEKSM